MMNDFDSVAPYYDSLAKVIFGKAIKQSQLEFIHLIPDNTEILILGGGTGWIIQSILFQVINPKITYVEKSKKMTLKAKSLFTTEEKTNITFITKAYEDCEFDNQFDIVIANFFLDLFTNRALKKAIVKIKSSLKSEGLLLVSDFQIHHSILSKLWQKPLFWLMHTFFKITARLESNSLQEINKEICYHGFEVKHSKLFYGKMIFSMVCTNKKTT